MKNRGNSQKYSKDKNLDFFGSSQCRFLISQIFLNRIQWLRDYFALGCAQTTTNRLSLSSVKRKLLMCLCQTKRVTTQSKKSKSQGKNFDMEVFPMLKSVLMDLASNLNIKIAFSFDLTSLQENSSQSNGKHDDESEKTLTILKQSLIEIIDLKVVLKQDDDTNSKRTEQRSTTLRSYACERCGEKFKHSSRVKWHRSWCLDGASNLTCQFCDRKQSEFKTRADLVSHLSRNHPEEEQPFACYFCDARFKLNTSLQKHLHVKHEQSSSSFQCQECPKRFVKKVYLTHHQSRFHNLPKNLLCQECGSSFISQSAFRNHIRSHQNPTQQLYKCSVCSKDFKRKDKLKIHMISVHEGVKPFQCEICPKSFVTKSKLSEHSRRHAGERRFSCLICNKRYSGSSDLRKHLAKTHPSIFQNIEPNLPLTPQIVASIRNANT